MRMIKGDLPYTGTAIRDSGRFDGSALYAAYAGEVSGAGGTVDDDSLTTGLLDDLVSSNLYSACGLGILAAGGSKAMGALNQRAYSVGPSFFANDVSGTGEFTAIDGSTYAQPAYTFTSSAGYLEWSDFELATDTTVSVIMLSPSAINGYGQGTTLTFATGGVTYFFTTGSVEYTSSASGSLDAVLRPDDDTAGYVPFVASWHLDVGNKTLYHTINGGTDFNGTSGERVANVWRDVPCPAVSAIGTLHVTGQPLSELVIITRRHNFDDALAFAKLRKDRYV